GAIAEGLDVPRLDRPAGRVGVVRGHAKPDPAQPGGEAATPAGIRGIVTAAGGEVSLLGLGERLAGPRGGRPTRGISVTFVQRSRSPIPGATPPPASSTPARPRGTGRRPWPARPGSDRHRPGRTPSASRGTARAPPRGSGRRSH